MSDDKPTRPRLIPKAKRPAVEGPFETLMDLGTHLPGTLGYIARRKLKRRHCNRAQDTFSEVLTDTGPGDLCIDLGANVGEFTLRLAETGADVISFEPDPGAYAALETAAGNRPNVTLIHKAAGHEDDTLVLHRSEKWSAEDPTAHTKSSSLVTPNKLADDSNAVMVEVVDIISFIEQLDRDVRIIKMDIEGAEWAIMNRLIDHPVLTRIDCIFVETHERIDPARYVPMFDELQNRAEQMTKPYINLYWI
ncbi:MAG: FkbM family methyltransferase [Pseudomonadota bacterium]